jgi:hypothetical protein
VGRRRYVGQNQRIGRGILTFALIAVLAVGAGFTVTKYIISNYFTAEKDLITEDTDQGDQDFPGSSIIIDQQEIKEGDPDNTAPSAPTNTPTIGGSTAGTKETINLYCIQFGSFSSKEGATAAAANLKASNIDTMVLMYDGSYKVIGTPFTKEEKAREVLPSMKAVAGEEVFITTMEAWMK